MFKKFHQNHWELSWSSSPLYVGQKVSFPDLQKCVSFTLIISAWKLKAFNNDQSCRSFKVDGILNSKNEAIFFDVQIHDSDSDWPNYLQSTFTNVPILNKRYKVTSLCSRDENLMVFLLLFFSVEDPRCC